jgi:hypothetical protein
MRLSHRSRELVEVEVVPPGIDLAVTDFESSHDRQFERPVGEREDVHSLGHDDRTIGRDVRHPEVDAFDTWPTRPDKGANRVFYVISPGDRILWNIMVDGVVSKECREFMRRLVF